MYVPLKFQPDSFEIVESFISAHPFATLIGIFDQKIIATHTPIHFSTTDAGENFLLGHISRANKQGSCFDGRQQMMAIFTGPHSYISSSWYSKPNVPTWNYIAVHVYGRARKMGQTQLIEFLKDMVEKYEEKMVNRFHLQDLPKKMMKAQLKGIVGFIMKIDEIQASFKLSQNRSEKDFQNIIAQLEKSGDEFSKMIAMEMKKTKS